MSSTRSISHMSPGLTVLILSALLGLQPITTDLYLPALPALTEGFGAAMSQAQLTLTALLLAFGVSQLIWGPLSDRFGRRPILLIGMTAYVLASVACTLSPSMDGLIFWRTVQGAAMGAGVMCARAIVRDLYTPVIGARVMSKGLSGLAVVACASAPLGGLLSDVFSWRMALLALGIFGAATLALLALRFEETVQQKNPKALEPATLLRTWQEILRNPTFLCRWLLPRFGVKRSVAIAGLLSITGGSLMAGLFMAGVIAPWAIIAPFYLFMLGHGIHQPCGQSGAIGPFPQAAGAASALNGFAMTVAAFAMGGWLGTHMDGTVYPLIYGIWFWSALIALAAWTLVQKQGAPHAS
jgi:DHA1 family bicyclomycin/chloramphenicol resistance-like MFS transporter